MLVVLLFSAHLTFEVLCSALELELVSFSLDTLTLMLMMRLRNCHQTVNQPFPTTEFNARQRRVIARFH
jgi:hypothetical protein